MYHPTIPEFCDWLQSLDLHVHSNIGCDKTPCDCGCCPHARTVYSVKTEHDPSVGIFGGEITPYLGSEGELWAYIQEHQTKVEANAMEGVEL